MAKKAKMGFSILWHTFASFLKKDPLTHGASIAFYTLVSLPGISLLITFFASSTYKSEIVQAQLMEQLHKFMGKSSVETVDIVLQNAQNLGETWWARVIGVLTLVFSATTVFISIQNALNGIWNLMPKPRSSILRYLINRMLSFAMVVSLGFLLLVTLVIDSFVLFLESTLSDLFSDVTLILLSAFNFVFSLALTSILFAMIFKFMPDAKIKWSQVRIGALVTSVLFIGGKYFLGLYLNYADIGSVYGAAGSLVVFLTWIYYSSIILLFGANFTYVYSMTKEENIRPSEHATFVVRKEVDELS